MAKKDLRKLAEHVLRDTTNALNCALSFADQIPLNERFVEPILTGPNGEVVQSEDAVERSRGVMIVGPPGSGKTTLLRFLANRQAADFLDRKIPRCPVFVAASYLALAQQHDRDLPALVTDVLNAQYGQDGLEALVRDSCVRGALSLFVDGLDEVAPTERTTVFRVVQNARETYPHLQLILSSRPSAIAGWPQGFVFFFIKDSADASVAEYLALVSRQDPSKAHQFLLAVRENSHLTQFARNPLLLTLLWQTFVVYGRLATNPAFLYADISDYLLSTWDRQKGINHRSQLSIDEVQRLLERIATYQFERQTFTLTRDEAIRLISLEGIPRTSTSTAEETLELLLTTGILHEHHAQTLSFVHLSFLEFYTARALAVDPQRLVNVIDRPNGHEIVVFACGIVQDVGPLVEAAVEKRLLLLAAKCISNGRLENQQLAQYVVQEFRREIGDRFLSLIVEDYSQGAPPTSVHGDLLNKWKLIRQPGILPVEKGRRLEHFTKEFFGQFFKVVRSNLNTEDGEIDIVLENTNASPFWLEFGADVLVECKNWSSHTPIHEIGAFGYKASRFRVRLAFFLAVSGFTPDAIRSMRNQAASGGPLIVPIINEDIERALETRELLEEFLKERIREVKYLQKY